MYKIALAGLGAGMFLAALAAANAVAKPTRHHPLYEGRSSYAPVYEGRSSSAPAAPGRSATISVANTTACNWRFMPPAVWRRRRRVQ